MVNHLETIASYSGELYEQLMRSLMHATEQMLGAGHRYPGQYVIPLMLSTKKAIDSGVETAMKAIHDLMLKKKVIKTVNEKEWVKDSADDLMAECDKSPQDATCSMVFLFLLKQLNQEKGAA